MNVQYFDHQLEDIQIPQNKFSVDDKKKMFTELLEVMSNDGKKD